MFPVQGFSGTRSTSRIDASDALSAETSVDAGDETADREGNGRQPQDTFQRTSSTRPVSREPMTLASPQKDRTIDFEA